MTDKPRVLVTAPFDADVVARLTDRFDVTAIEPSLDGLSLAEMGLDAELATANVVVAELDVVDEATLALAPELRLVVCAVPSR